MKVLFAVNNETISESIVKKYQKKYKEIISYKNVYYFNAILKELQKDKTYDRIVVSEDLEQFTNTSYEQMDKFIFERLDSISDEASNMKGEDIPIILICTERRAKSEEVLVKLFGIGIYNAIIGNDRSIDEVCRLIYKPRLKKEAKTYYNIDSENVSYKAENEDDVSEVEIQNILAHFKRLGKDETKYLDSYNNIAEQYNDNQLRVISKFLPLGVRAVLEEQSPKYQQVMAFNKSVSQNLKNKKGKEEEGLSEILLTNSKHEQQLDGPIVVPSSMNSNENVKKLTRTPRPKAQPQLQSQPQSVQPRPQPQPRPVSTASIEPVNTYTEEPEDSMIDIEPIEPVIPETPEVLETPKRGRGRPRKNPLPSAETASTPKRGRGRPRKNPLPEPIEEIPEVQEIEEAPTLPEIEEIYEDERETTLPGMEETYEQENGNVLPGIEDEDYEEDTVLPGIENNYETEDEPILQGIDNRGQSNNSQAPQLGSIISKKPMSQPRPIRPISEPIISAPINNYNYSDNYSENSHVDLSSVLEGNKKVAAFVGTSKNGTSFIVNNLAEILSSTGVNVAILDTTQNRNSYYIYTKNEEDLRRIAMSSIDNLVNGVASGIRVNNNLAVYTSLPNEGAGIGNVQNILETLIKSHSVVLIDCDFWTPKGYFSAAQEVYLVQTMDVLTIQPLTAFLKDLVVQNILEEQKIRVVLNKYIRVKGVTEREIIGGMAYYNDPAMTYQTGLFDKGLVKYITIPFEEETYVKYLEGLINCEISLKGYSKMFMQNLKQLGNMVYPLMSSKGVYRPPALGNTNGNTGAFSSSMNNTLDQMKRNY